MTIQQSLLWSYRLLLQLYPPAFRKRFAEEMMELAEAAEPDEWALIFGDTSLGVVRCWLEGSPSTAAVAEPDAYLAVGVSPIRRRGFLQGFVLSVAILIGLCYFSHWTAYRECPGTAGVSTRSESGAIR
jgi:hypothetical protein